MGKWNKLRSPRFRCGNEYFNDESDGEWVRHTRKTPSNTCNPHCIHKRPWVISKQFGKNLSQKKGPTRRVMFPLFFFFCLLRHQPLVSRFKAGYLVHLKNLTPRQINRNWLYPILFIDTVERWVATNSDELWVEHQWVVDWDQPLGNIRLKELVVVLAQIYSAELCKWPIKEYCLSFENPKKCRRGSFQSKRNATPTHDGILFVEINLQKKKVWIRMCGRGTTIKRLCVCRVRSDKWKVIPKVRWCMGDGVKSSDWVIKGKRAKEKKYGFAGRVGGVKYKMKIQEDLYGIVNHRGSSARAEGTGHWSSLVMFFIS